MINIDYFGIMGKTNRWEAWRIQAEAGLESGYATVAAMRCVRTNCCWRSGCYSESEGGPSVGNGSKDLDRERG
jgi:hypothetical protein